MPDSIATTANASSALEAEVVALRRQVHDITRMAGALVHEIRNPLSTMILNLDLIREDLGDSKTTKDQRVVRKVDRVRQETLRLQDLLEAFLGIVRLEKITLEPTDLNTLVEDLCDFFEPQAASHNIVLRQHLDPAMPVMGLNPELLKQALLNLSLNAQQAMPEGGELILTTRARPDHVILEVTDTGKGIDEHDLAKVFEPFYSTRKGGSGLGLSTCRRIIEAHGGQISVHSRLGVGTKFILSFPIRETATPLFEQVEESEDSIRN